MCHASVDTEPFVTRPSLSCLTIYEVLPQDLRMAPLLTDFLHMSTVCDPVVDAKDSIQHLLMWSSFSPRMYGVVRKTTTQPSTLIRDDTRDRSISVL